MAITFVASAEQASSTDVTPLTFTVDIGTRTNGLLVVGVSTRDNASNSHANPTWNGAAMGTAVTGVSEVTTGIYVCQSIFYLANPANGSNAFSVDYDDGGTDTANTCYIIAAWVDGAHQTQASVKDQHATGTGSTDPSVDITPTENGEFIFAIYHTEADSVLTVGADETLLQEHDFGLACSGGSYAIQGTAALQTINFAGTDDNWRMTVASFKQAAAAATARPFVRSPMWGSF